MTGLPQNMEDLSFDEFLALWHRVKSMSALGRPAPRAYRDKMEAEAKRRLNENGEKLAEIDREIHMRERVKVSHRIGRLT